MPIQWNIYNNFIKHDGETQRDRTINRTKKDIAKMIKHSPAYKQVLIDGKPQEVAIISSSTELDTKKITSMPNETINIGSIVEWNNEHWIVYDNDCEDVIYQRGLMYRCNVYLKWQNEKGEIIGRYGYISDSTKQGEGLTHRSDVMNLINQFYKGYFPLDNETIKIRRDKRFLIDIDNEIPDAYIVTNRKTMPYNFNAEDISDSYELNTKDHLIIFMFSQCERNEEKDNFELMIADYFEPNELVQNNGIYIGGEPSVKLGGTFKKFNIENNVNNINLSWNITYFENQEKYFDVRYNIDNSIEIKAKYNESLLDTQFKLSLLDENNNIISELYVKVVNLYG